MHKLVTLAAVAFSAAAFVPGAALADDPLSAIKADITQLQADVQVKHDTVLADATKLQSDAQSLVGSDKATAKATIKADATKLTIDWKSLLATCLTDRAKLQSDIAAARAAGVTGKEIRPVVRQANLQIRASNLIMRAGVLNARVAVITLRQSFGHGAPTITTPPASPAGLGLVTG